MAQNLNSGYGQSLAQAPFGAGKVFHVCKANSTTYDYLSKALVPDPDGIQRLYGASSAAADVAINDALAETIANRNDYVIIWPDTDDYECTATITIANKSTHLICPAGIPVNGMVAGATNAARLDFSTASAVNGITVTGQNIEVAGFWIKGDVDKSGIEVSASAHAHNIHHNTIGLNTTAGSASMYGIHGTGEQSNGIVAYNYITCMYPTTTKTLGGGIVFANMTRGLIQGNIIYTGAFAQTFTVGIAGGSGAGCMIIGNKLFEGIGPSGAGVFTKGITVPTNGCAFENRVCMNTVANSINGGTADKTASGNYDSNNGGDLQDVD